jgi:hypothetical protein
MNRRFTIMACAGDRDQKESDRHQRNAETGSHAEHREGEVDGGELGDQGQEIDDFQVHQREQAPPAPETLVDHRGVPFAGGDAETHHHFLNEVRHRQQEQHQPQQMGPILRSRLGVGGDRTSVVVGHHYDQPGAEHGQEREQAVRPPGFDHLPADGHGLESNRARGNLNRSIHHAPPLLAHRRAHLKHWRRIYASGGHRGGRAGRSIFFEGEELASSPSACSSVEPRRMKRQENLPDHGPRFHDSDLRTRRFIVVCSHTKFPETGESWEGKQKSHFPRSGEMADYHEDGWRFPHWPKLQHRAP